MQQFYIVAIIAIILSFLARINKFESCFFLAFVILTLFLSLGYEWGNDVSSYHYFWNQYTDSGYSFLDFNNLIELNNKNELVWVSLCILCKPLGFYGFRALLFSVENYIIYHFIKKYVNKRWYWLAMLIYTFNPFFFVLSSSMMRQWLAICTSIVAIDCFFNKKVKASILLVIFAFFIHRSVCIVIFIPIFLLLTQKQVKHSLIMIASIMALYYALSNSIVHYVTTWLTSEDVYSNYSGVASQSGIGVTSIAKVILYTLLFFYARTLIGQKRDIMRIPILYSFILPFLSYSTVAARMGFYYTIYTICAYPIFMQEIKCNKQFKALLLCIIIIYMVYSSYIFFMDPIYKPYYYTYRNLLEVGSL